MLKTIYEANIAIENYDFKKLVEVENQTVRILTIKFAGRDESGFKYWGLCKYPEDTSPSGLVWVWQDSSVCFKTMPR